MDPYITLFSEVARPLLICFVAVGAFVGMLAVVSPRATTLLAAKGNHWVDTRSLFRVPDNKLSRIFDKWIETDQWTLRYSRLTGIVVLVEAAILGYLCFVG